VSVLWEKKPPKNNAMNLEDKESSIIKMPFTKLRNRSSPGKFYWQTGELRFVQC
jgi:hypothetical protein